MPRFKEHNDIFGEDSNATVAYNYFVEKGYSPIAASGIVGNLMQESTSALSPTIVNKTSGAFGIAQWLGSRKVNLKEWSMENGRDINDFKTQLDFIDYELNTTEKRAKKALMGATNVKDAAFVFENKFERAGEKLGDKPMADRINNAGAVFSYFTGQKAVVYPSGVNADPNTVSYVDYPNQEYTYGSGVDSEVAPYTPIPDVTIDKDSAFMEYFEMLKNEKDQEAQRREQQIEQDKAKALLVRKSKEREFLFQLVNSSNLEFVER